MEEVGEGKVGMCPVAVMVYLRELMPQFNQGHDWEGLGYVGMFLCVHFNQPLEPCHSHGHEMKGEVKCFGVLGKGINIR